jgi:hypothetical protein
VKLVFGPILKGVGLAASPAGRKVIGRAVKFARSDEGRKVIAKARKAADSPEARKLAAQALRAAQKAKDAAQTPENRRRLETAAGFVRRHARTK